MKLNPDFITQDVEDTQFLVPMGAEAFRGIARGNETAAFIVNCLKQDTSFEAVVDAVCAEYDAPRATVEAAVKEILATLRRIGALCE